MSEEKRCWFDSHLVHVIQRRGGVLDFRTESYYDGLPRRDAPRWLYLRVFHDGRILQCRKLINPPVERLALFDFQEYAAADLLHKVCDVL